MPNAAQIHLALNHMPAAVDVAALLVLLIGLLWRSVPVIRASFAVMIFAALLAIPTYYTGEGAEHLVKGMERVNRPAIHPHEDAAEWAFVVILVQGGAALLALIVFRKRAPAMWAIAMIALLSLVSIAAMLRTAQLGGKIQHPETQLPASGGDDD
ncbi:MAG: hypothetical protein QOH21_449 [Acidobacteriota bacterium]|jgi:dolichol kinase|nr:hypothetical protein [Acidobacteriota bacterium]